MICLPLQLLTPPPPLNSRMQSRHFLKVCIEANVCLQTAAVTDQILLSRPTQRNEYALVQCISVCIFMYQSHTHSELNFQGFKFNLQK